MNDLNTNQDKFIAYFHRHIVPIVFLLKKDQVSAPYVVTAFVLSVQERWFLVTAGHCLQKVDEYKKDSYIIDKCYLMDTMGEGATHLEHIIFTYDLAKPQYIPDSRELDYGIIPLSTYYQQLLSANNITPLSEDVWRIQPNEPETFVLLGSPTENLQISEDSIGVVTALNWIEECEKPDYFPNTETPLFYGRITLHSNQKSVRGMSGGPIFAFQLVNEQYKYWLKALQSRWIEQSEIVIGCPTILLGSTLDKMIEEGSI